MSYVLATVYRTIGAAKWRIWAFDKVRNVHELQERAITEKLLYLTNRPGFGVIHYNSVLQKEKWEQLQVKFQQRSKCYLFIVANRALKTSFGIK